MVAATIIGSLTRPQWGTIGVPPDQRIDLTHSGGEGDSEFSHSLSMARALRVNW